MSKYMPYTEGTRCLVCEEGYFNERNASDSCEICGIGYACFNAGW
jgi:hypothetical protein